MPQQTQIVLNVQEHTGEELTDNCRHPASDKHTLLGKDEFAWQAGTHMGGKGLKA